MENDNLLTNDKLGNGRETYQEEKFEMGRRTHRHKTAINLDGVAISKVFHRSRSCLQPNCGRSRKNEYLN